jgi:hypothetical protein
MWISPVGLARVVDLEPTNDRRDRDQVWQGNRLCPPDQDRCHRARECHEPAELANTVVYPPTRDCACAVGSKRDRDGLATGWQRYVTG